MLRALFVCFLLLSSCATTHAPFSDSSPDVFSAATFLGDEFITELSPAAVSFGRPKSVPVKSWKIDKSFVSQIQEATKARKREFKALALDSQELERALKVREGRFEKTVGKYNQAVMDLLFRQAEKQGVNFLFLGWPINKLERFPLYFGPMGMHCASKENRAFIYFVFDFSLWDVKAQKKIFQGTVTPDTTEVMSFADCTAAAQLPHPVEQLEDPAKKTLELLVDALFRKMGWAEANSGAPGKP